MTDPKDMTDDQFLGAFLDCTMPPAGFDHLGHVRAAWIALQRLPLEQAVDTVCDGIGRLAAHLGVPGKYHRTLSEALVRLMAQGGGADTHVTWPRFIAANPLLISDAKGLLALHYSDERLAMPEARVSFVTPDRLPLPL